MTLSSFITLAAVTVGTWNGQWFPSGRAEHRAAPEVEARTIADAGRLIRDGLQLADPTGTNDLILCFNEIRGPKVAQALCEAIGRTNLTVAIVSGYRRRDRFDQQQDVIATTLPVVASNWSRWKFEKKKDESPPRGYARAKIVISPTVTATVYAVHLKSSYITKKAEAEIQTALNRAKRAAAVAQLLEQERQRRGKAADPVIVAGDLNADPWPKDGAPESFFAALAEAGFINPMERRPANARITYPGRGKWANQSLDHILLRDLRPDGAPVTISSGRISDHNPVFVTLETESEEKEK